MGPKKIRTSHSQQDEDQDDKVWSPNMCGRQRHGCGGVGVARERTGRFGAESCNEHDTARGNPNRGEWIGGQKRPSLFRPKYAAKNVLFRALNLKSCPRQRPARVVWALAGVRTAGMPGRLPDRDCACFFLHGNSSYPNSCIF